MLASKVWFVALLLSFATVAEAADEFDRLVNRLPRSANAVLLLNVEKALQSPMGKFEGWKENLEKAFDAGIARVPPQSTRFVLGAELDFDYLKPIWEAAAVDLKVPFSVSDVAKKRGGQTDTIESLAAVALPEDVYVLQFDENTLGAIGPANRKMTTGWLRDIKAGLKLSPYLSKAAAFSDQTGSEIILAVDLDGAFSLESIVAYLKNKPMVKDVKKAAKFLSDVQGIRLGIRLTQPPTAAVAVDCGATVDVDATVAKDALLQVLSDGGVLLSEMRDWNCNVKANEVNLSGKLTKNGLRRILSLVESPTESQAPSAHTPDTATTTPTDPKKQMAEATLKHFKAVTEMFDDLKGEMKNAANLAVTATYFDRYAKRIERLPILSVDPAMLDYSGYVASALRQASNAVRTMGIRGASRQHQIDYTDIEYDYAYGYRSNWDGSAAYAVPVSDGVSAVKAVGAERRKVRAEEKGIAATDVHTIRAEVIDATSKIRRSMTQKYQTEF